MRMTREEFIEMWRDRVAGIALRGVVLDSDERPVGPRMAGNYAMKIPEKTEKLLGLMFDSLKPREEAMRADAATGGIRK